ncbi:hypothetical protein [Scytonema sp. HK-05]|nr:hypothetical protein [Scytonema sp. HK-05]
MSNVKGRDRSAKSPSRAIALSTLCAIKQAYTGDRSYPIAQAQFFKLY